MIAADEMNLISSESIADATPSLKTDQIEVIGKQIPIELSSNAVDNDTCTPSMRIECGDSQNGIETVDQCVRRDVAVSNMIDTTTPMVEERTADAMNVENNTIDTEEVYANKKTSSFQNSSDAAIERLVSSTNPPSACVKDSCDQDEEDKMPDSGYWSDDNEANNILEDEEDDNDDDDEDDDGDHQSTDEHNNEVVVAEEEVTSGKRKRKATAFYDPSAIKSKRELQNALRKKTKKKGKRGNGAKGDSLLSLSGSGKRPRKEGSKESAPKKTANKILDLKSYPWDVQRRVKKNAEKKEMLLGDLNELESSPHFCDRDLLKAKAISEFRMFALSFHLVAKEDMVITDTAAVVDTSLQKDDASDPCVEVQKRATRHEQVLQYIKCLSARSAQGSHLPLHNLVTEITSSIDEALADNSDENMVTAEADEMPKIEGADGIDAVAKVVGGEQNGDASAVPSTTSPQMVNSPPVSSSKVIDKVEQLSEIQRDNLVEVAKIVSGIDLHDIVKLLAVRTAHGVRSKDSTMFDDTDPRALWRWEVTSMQYFDPKFCSTISNDSNQVSNTTNIISREVKIIREVRSARSKFGRTLKALHVLDEQLLKVPLMEGKVVPLEERLIKCEAEIIRTKERRRELEAKEGAIKNRVDKQREKVEASAARKKATIDAMLERSSKANTFDSIQKKPEVLTEKQIKEQKKLQLLEKQRNAMRSFFMKPASSGSAAGTHEGIREKSSSSTVIDLSGLDNQHTSADSSIRSQTHDTSSDNVCGVDTNLSANAANEEALRAREADFDEALKSSYSLSEISTKISTYFRKSRTSRCFRRKNRNVKLMVAICKTADDNDPFATKPAYTEITERDFDGYMRTLRFHTDYRPAYVGTFSKKSKVINGRNPLVKDYDMFNYDYDSEEEWEEEEEEGEDIIDSDVPEEDDEENELVYDDMFCRDDDFGSDVDSVDGGLARQTPRNTAIIEEAYGPCFLTSASVNSLTDNNPMPYALSHYYSVSFNIQGPLPMIGKEGTGSLKTIWKRGGPSNSTSRDDDTTGNASKVSGRKKKGGFDEALMRRLALFMHGRKVSENNVEEFQKENSSVTMNQIKIRIPDLLQKQRHPDGHGSVRWAIKPDIINTLKLKEMENGFDERIDYTPPKQESNKKPLLTIGAALDLQRKFNLAAEQEEAESTTYGGPIKKRSKKSITPTSSVWKSDKKVTFADDAQQTVEDVDASVQPEKKTKVRKRVQPINVVSYETNNSLDGNNSTAETATEDALLTVNAKRKRVTKKTTETSARKSQKKISSILQDSSIEGKRRSLRGKKLPDGYGSGITAGEESKECDADPNAEA